MNEQIILPIIAVIGGLTGAVAITSKSSEVRLVFTPITFICLIAAFVICI